MRIWNQEWIRSASERDAERSALRARARASNRQSGRPGVGPPGRSAQPARRLGLLDVVTLKPFILVDISRRLVPICRSVALREPLVGSDLFLVCCHPNTAVDWARKRARPKWGRPATVTRLGLRLGLGHEEKRYWVDELGDY